MIHSIPNILEYVSKYMTINEGDIFLMGTPSGIGPVININTRLNKAIQLKHK